MPNVISIGILGGNLLIIGTDPSQPHMSIDMKLILLLPDLRKMKK